MNVALILSLLLLGCVVHHCDCLPRKDDDEKMKAQLASLDNEPDWLKPLSSDNDTDELIPMPAVLQSPDVESGISGLEAVGVSERAYGYVTSPGYSSNRYPNNYQGYWRSYTSRGYVFRVSFTVLSLEYHSRCAYDSVSLYDGYTRSARLIGKYCRTAPSVITTTGRSIYLYFKTDYSVNTGRFLMRWQTVRQSQSPPASCGTPAITPSVSTRIVGGTEARAHSWPWQCKLYMYKNDGWYGCGGSVISNRYILTAAHCLYFGRTRSSDQRQQHGDVVVKCGIHSLRVNSASVQRFSAGIRTIVHENYNRQTLDNDIALIRLPRALTFNNYVHPVCLPRSSVRAGTNCVVTGWGRTQNTGDSSVLRQAVVATLPHATCRARWGSFTRNMLCADTAGGKGSCNGDSGGPLVCKQGNKWLQYGIVSYGHNRNCVHPRYPSAYANVVNLRSWIQRKTGIRPTGRQTYDDDSSDDDSEPPIKPDVVENDLVDDDDSNPPIEPYVFDDDDSSSPDDLFEEEKEMLDELQRKSADRNFDDDSSDDDSDPPIEPYVVEKELEDKPPPDDVNGAEKELLDLLQRKFADD